MQLLIIPRKTKYIHRRDWGFSDFIFVLIPKAIYRTSKVVWQDYGPVVAVMIVGFIGSCIYVLLFGKVDHLMVLWRFFDKYWYTIMVTLLAAYMTLRALMMSTKAGPKPRRKLPRE